MAPGDKPNHDLTRFEKVDCNRSRSPSSRNPSGWVLTFCSLNDTYRQTYGYLVHWLLSHEIERRQRPFLLVIASYWKATVSNLPKGLQLATVRVSARAIEVSHALGPSPALDRGGRRHCLMMRERMTAHARL
jgi:hypothetical protein